MSDEPEAAEAVEEEDTAEAEDVEVEEEAEADGLQEGDFVKLSYTIWTVEERNLVDTTDEELAEEEGIDTEDQEFGPRTIVIGAGHVFDAVEADLEGKEVGDSGAVEVEAVDAFGEFDPDQVRTVSADKIPEDSRYPGAHVNVDGEHGHVETIIGGRARVDFNHPLAGEDIEYEYDIVDVVSDRLERAQGLLDMYLDIGLDMWIETEEEEQTVYNDEGEEEGTETVEVEILYIEATPQLSMNQQWMFSKQQIAGELVDRIGVDKVIVQEELGGGGMGLGGLGGMDMEAALEDIDDEDVDAEELVEELGGEEDLELVDEPEG